MSTNMNRIEVSEFRVFLFISWVFSVHSMYKSVLLDYNYWSHSPRFGTTTTTKVKSKWDSIMHHLILVSVPLPFWFGILLLQWNEQNKNHIIIVDAQPDRKRKKKHFWFVRSNFVRLYSIVCHYLLLCVIIIVICLAQTRSQQSSLALLVCASVRALPFVQHANVLCVCVCSRYCALK